MRENNYTWYEAIIIALGSRGSASNMEEIYNQIVQDRLYVPKNENGTPHRTIASTISVSINNDGNNSPFKKFTAGIYELSNIGKQKYKELTSNKYVSNYNNIHNELEGTSKKDISPLFKRIDIIKHLKDNQNIILHGAPGTGKTYLAKEIAKAMCDVDDIKKLEDSGQFKMVQFHPSYDYTDFVEGLRPTGTDNKGNIIFARQDGVFKTFCKTATPPSYESVFSILYDKIKNGDTTTYKIQKEYKLRVEDNNIQYEVAQGWRTYNYLKTLYNYYITHDDIDIENIKADDINKIIGDDKEIKANSADYGPHKWAIQELINIAKDLKNNCRSKCIFLIDEINRGDMSKIFGELFYAIDPGYRGVDGKIDTQYQNLIDKQGDDPFKDGFYVPDNVYIIGTMNDIDRSVESMDFAMRRRFQFIEVTAEDRAYGMGLKKDEKADYKTKDAYARMTNLNNCIISKKIGLSKAYQIGGSYFLSNEKDDKGNRIPIKDNFNDLWQYRLEGLLREYLRGEEELVINEKLETILKPAFNCDEGHIYNKDGELETGSKTIVETT